MSDTIAPLFSIMLDEDEFMSRRLEAAEQILGFESPPDAVEATKAFLRKVYKGKTASRRDKLKAIGLIRRAEDRKTAPLQSANPMDGLADRIGAARKAFLEEKMVKLGLAKGPNDD